MFEAVNQMRQQMDQQKLEFREERERLNAKMSASLSCFNIIVVNYHQLDLNVSVMLLLLIYCHYDDDNDYYYYY